MAAMIGVHYLAHSLETATHKFIHALHIHIYINITHSHTTEKTAIFLLHTAHKSSDVHHHGVQFPHRTQSCTNFQHILYIQIHRSFVVKFDKHFN